MKIQTLSAHAVPLPLRRPTRISTRRLDQRDYLLVYARAEDGNEVGLGYAYAGTSGGELLALIVDEMLAPLVVGADAGDMVALWERMYRDTLLSGRRGAVLRALSAVDIALWDLAAKRAGLPLAVLLGGSVRPVAAYASGGYYGEGPAAAAAVAEEVTLNRARGFSDHKIKVGGLSPQEDAERVAAAIGAIGGRGRLAIDANNAYRNVHEALAAIRLFERAARPAALWWVEEPLLPDDVDGLASLARRVETPIATGEIAQTRWEFRALLRVDAPMVLQPDAGVLGGVTEWTRVVRAAETFGVPVAPHWHANLHAHLAAASSNCLAVEHFLLEKDIYNFELLMTAGSRLGFGDGHVLLSDRPGIGVELDPDAVARYLLPRRGR